MANPFHYHLCCAFNFLFDFVGDSCDYICEYKSEQSLYVCRSH